MKTFNVYFQHEFGGISMEVVNAASVEEATASWKKEYPAKYIIKIIPSDINERTPADYDF